MMSGAGSLASKAEAAHRTRLDIRPSQTLNVLRNAADGAGVEWAAMRWGFDVDWMDRLLINAKAESMTSRFWSAARPGIAFMSGFYEWPDKPGGRKPANYRRYHFTLRDGAIMMIAALWRPWPIKQGPIKQGQGKTVDCVALCTTAPNSLMLTLPHHRMPGILTKETARLWMQSTPRDRATLIPTYPSELMQCQGVAEPRNDDLQTLLPLGDPLA